MAITTAKYTDNGSVTITIDGQEWSGITEASRFWAEIEAWEAEGNTIQPYVLPPESTVYPPLSKAAFWLAALDLGVKKEDVQAHITLIPDEYQREQMRILLEETATYRRESPMVELFSTILGIPEEQINDVWLWAAESDV